MAPSNLRLPLLFLLLPIAAAAAPTMPAIQQQQINNIVDALIGSGDFATWASLLSAADPASIPVSATLFIPADNALPASFDPYILPYHVLPRRLTFADLCLLPRDSRLPTLLPDHFILVTDNSRTNFTLDNDPVTHPDLYLAATVAVHGLATVLDYHRGLTSSGGEPVLVPVPVATTPRPSPPPPAGEALPGGEIIGGRISGVGKSFPGTVVSWVACSAAAFGMTRFNY